MKMLRRLVALAAGLSALVVLTACGGRSEAAGPKPTVISIHFSHFQQEVVTARAGQPISLIIRNDDPIDHEWIVGDEATHTRHRLGTEPHHGERPTEQSIAALSSVRTTVTFQTPGTYRYICHLPGHEAYGMVGVVTVTGG